MTGFLADNESEWGGFKLFFGGGVTVVVTAGFVFSSFSRKDVVKPGKHLGVVEMLDSSHF